MNTTIHDIAREAGVSIASVSRVLNGTAVRAETRKKVEAAIRKLEFVPNYFARGLSARASHAVGVLITSMSNSYYMEVTEAIEVRLREKGYNLVLCSTGLDPALEREYLTEQMSRRVDGCIVMDPSIENYRSGFLARVAARLPMVFVQPDPDILDLNSVVVDQRYGMRKVMEYLNSLGHEDIAFVRGKRGHSYDIKEEVWRGFLARRGMSRADELLVLIPEGNRAEAIVAAEEAMAPLLAGPSRPSAVFACNDLMARGVLRAASRAGVAVPRDLSVCGHDNSVLAVSGTMALTTVDLKMKSQGRAAVDLLLHALEGSDPALRRILIAPELLVRDSTARRPG